MILWAHYISMSYHLNTLMEILIVSQNKPEFLDNVFFFSFNRRPGGSCLRNAFAQTKIMYVTSTLYVLKRPLKIQDYIEEVISKKKLQEFK